MNEASRSQKLTPGSATLRASSFGTLVHKCMCLPLNGILAFLTVGNFSPTISIMTKPTLLFVHGAWHSPQCWEKIIPKLEANGYKCIAPQCLHSGTSEPIDKLEPCIEQLQDILAAETSTGNDVILIGHSFGGVVSSSAVKGFTSQDPSKLKSKDSGKVIGLALMTAMVVPTGLSFGKYNAGGQPVNKGIGAPAGDGWTTLVPDPKECLYQDLPDKEAEK